MALEPGKIYTPSGPDEIRRDVLDDIELGAQAAGVADPPTQPDTDWYILGTALGNLGMLEYSNVSVNDRNASVLEAVGDELDSHREGLGLPIVEPSVSSGRIVISVPGGGNHTISEGKQLVWPNGNRGKVSRTFLGATDGDEVEVVSIDTGEVMNLDAGAVVKFVDPPIGVDINAEVSAAQPISGGLDEETDERKRDRILNRLRTRPASGNWGDNIETALNALGSIQYAFVYPGLGGPASRKVVLVRDIQTSKNLFTRIPTGPQVSTVRTAIHTKLPDGSENIVQAVAEEQTDVALVATLPEAAAAGGDGTGWVDATKWPTLNGDTRVAITTSTSTTQVTLGGLVATGATAGQTHIAWYSSVSQRFEVRLVTAVSGSAGAWVITVDKPMVDHLGNKPTVGDYVCPAAVNTVEYGEVWREVMRRLGPGENTSSANLTPRASRRPFTTRDWHHSLGVKQLTAVTAAFPEISDADWSYRSITTPTVPGSIATAPNVLVPRHFGIYPQ